MKKWESALSIWASISKRYEVGAKLPVTGKQSVFGSKLTSF